MQLPDRHSFTGDDWAGIRALLELARMGSFTAAADRLGISQPTLTRQVQRLERRLGLPLVERTTRRVAVTAAGRALVAEAAAFDDGARAALAALWPDAAPSGPMTLAALGVVYPDLVERLQAQWPAVEWRTAAMNLDQALTEMTRGDVDLYTGFRYPYQVSSTALGVRVVRFARIPLWVYLAADHPLADAAVVPLTGLADDGWITTADQDGHDSLVRVCRTAGLEPRIVHRARDMASVRELLEAGRGVTLGSPGSDPAPGTVARPVSPQPYGDMVLAWRRDRWGEPAARELFDVVRSWYEHRSRTRAPYAAWLDAHPSAFPREPVPVDPAQPLDPFEA